MKKKIKVLLAGVCAFSLLIGPKFTALADENETIYKGSGEYSNTTTPATITTDDDSPSDNPVEVKVYGMVTGYGGIVYNVSVKYQDMSYVYDYGGKWNPETHTYSASPNNIGGNGGWVTSYLENNKNQIIVSNNSNYPIDAALSFEFSGGVNPFNVESTSTSVMGIFDTSDANLKNTIVANKTDTLNTAETNPVIRLKMDTSKIATGQAYYTVTAANTNSSKYTNTEENIFFGLIGVPDANVTITSMTEIGAIKVQISPANNVIKEIKQ